MNKAFVKESEEEDDDLPEGTPALPQGTKNYMTPQGYATLKAELDFLLKEERPRLVEVVHWAASNGDRSENGDYIYGKRRLREIDRRLRFLSKRLEASEVVNPALQPNQEQVFFGASVTILTEEDKEETYQIVGLDEVDLPRGKISWISPLARALLKAREGDQVSFDSPKGRRTIEVIGIAYLAGDPL